MAKLTSVLLSFILRAAAEASAVLEMSGDAGKIIWSELENPVCELILDRANTRLNSTCDIFTTENDLLKAEVSTLEAKVSTVEADNTELMAWKTEMEAKMEHILKTITPPPPNLPPSSPPSSPPPSPPPSPPLPASPVTNQTITDFYTKVGSLEASQDSQSSSYINWSSKGLTDDDMMVMSHIVISNGALASLEKLYLSNNQIGDAGMQAFSTALAGGALTQLQYLDFECNQIGDAGFESLASACASGAMPQLKQLCLNENQIGDEGLKSLSEALTCGALAQVTCHIPLSWRQPDRRCWPHRSHLSVHQGRDGVTRRACGP